MPIISLSFFLTTSLQTHMVQLDPADLHPVLLLVVEDMMLLPLLSSLKLFLEPITHPPLPLLLLSLLPQTNLHKSI